MRILDFYNSIKEQRYLSIIIHSKPNAGLSEFAKKSADILNAKYFNLYQYFLKNGELSSNIDSFTDQSLIEILHEKAKGSSILIIDQIDFLIDTWTKREFKDFLNMFDKQWDRWNLDSKTGLIVFIETNNVLEDADIKFQNDTKKIYKLSEFSSL